MSNGWPLGLGNMNVRLGMVEISGINVFEPSSLRVYSTSFTSFTSSDLDSESTKSFFCDNNISLGQIINITPGDEGDLYFTDRTSLGELREVRSFQGICIPLIQRVLIRIKLRQGRSDGLHLLTEEAVITVDEAACVRPRKSRRYPGGLTGPLQHFKAAVGLYSKLDYMLCRLFNMSLKEKPLRWFYTIQEASITTLSQLQHLFESNYAHAKERKITVDSLFFFERGTKETLASFYKRFLQEVRKIGNSDPKIVVPAFTSALHIDSKVREELTLYKP
ncbi:hypothetical protein GIB67_039222 [Kingdonia uniflora]|uniref:Retrotransposon gag domain-containing protein n=1 Tax=Kingdonia uniflora TaxID=39325 RepID=A0A7J7MLZ9_9MAGN|nr:hypothetical protein GIB67_039222 [Kingdonia uniflora]